MARVVVMAGVVMERVVVMARMVVMAKVVMAGVVVMTMILTTHLMLLVALERAEAGAALDVPQPDGVVRAARHHQPANTIWNYQIQVLN
jgi:hypothetical protein